ncbi:hypothetical protein GC163_18745 [bacterium]|nr:hypothetical protein [bacterium]
MRASLRTIHYATACLCLAAPMSQAVAQEPSVGIVRISDAKGSFVQPAGMKGEYHSMSGNVGYGYSMDGSCPHCQGYGGKHGGKSCRFCEHYCTHSADHGYSIPAKWPIQRRGVQYQSLFPNAWYGTPEWNAMQVQGAPMVYQPTDTTQLGFYYQHVPFWQPQPNPLPQRPIPAEWHRYAPVVYASQFQNGYTKGGMSSEYPVYYETVTPTQPTPTELQPVPEPMTTEPLPPAPPAPVPAPVQESAVPLPLQRVSY